MEVINLLQGPGIYSEGEREAGARLAQLGVLGAPSEPLQMGSVLARGGIVFWPRAIAAAGGEKRGGELGCTQASPPPWGPWGRGPRRRWGLSRCRSPPLPPRAVSMACPGPSPFPP